MSKRAAIIEQRTRRHREAAARATDGFVRTPAALAETIVTGHPEIGSLPPGACVLEPSAGDGAMVRAILDADRDAHVIAVEPNDERADALDALAREHPGRVTVRRQTFERYAEENTGAPIDAVIMNPPFGDSTRAVVWIDHVRAAWDLLRPGAFLVSVVPHAYAYRGDRQHREFREWATAQGARYEKLPAGSFVESGTGTGGGLLTLPKPLPARPDGLPAWLLRPAVGAPVPVPGPWTGFPRVTAQGAAELPVQEYEDRCDGSRPRVLRHVGQCFACGRHLWQHDDRHGAAAFEACTLDAEDYGQAGPSLLLCLDHYHTDAEGRAAIEARALAEVAPFWSDAPAAPDPADPIAYPLDLTSGCWATVAGVDYRGWQFTITGRVMRDPERATSPHDGAERIAVELRTARGVRVELYAEETGRVVVRDVPADVIPAPAPAPEECGARLAAVAVPDGTGSVATCAAPADRCPGHGEPESAASPQVSPWVAEIGQLTLPV